MKKSLGILILIIGLAFVLWGYKNYKQVPIENTTDGSSEISGLLTYTDPEGVFSFQYPREFNVSGRDGAMLAKVTVPQSYMPGTNFNEAWLTVNWSNASSSVLSCSGTSINTGAAAGNRYDTTTHKEIFDGDCYTLEYVIHYSNIQNYDPSQGITEFNENKIKGELEKIVQSFKYLVNSD